LLKHKFEKKSTIPEYEMPNKKIVLDTHNKQNNIQREDNEEKYKMRSTAKAK
jgi:hypothetical protein